MATQDRVSLLYLLYSMSTLKNCCLTTVFTWEASHIFSFVAIFINLNLAEAIAISYTSKVFVILRASVLAFALQAVDYINTKTRYKSELDNTNWNCINSVFHFSKWTTTHIITADCSFEGQGVDIEQLFTEVEVNGGGCLLNHKASR